MKMVAVLMGGRSSKVKGSSFERNIVNTLKENGIEAKRVPLSGALDDLPGDVKFGPDCKLQGECKHHENMNKKLWEWLEGNDALFIKRNHCEPLVVMTLDEYMKLLKEHHVQTNCISQKEDSV